MSTLEVEPVPLPGLQRRQRAGELVGVNYPERTIELVVIPYDVETIVRHPTKPAGPPVGEVISRHAFNGVERRANRVRANREHREALTFGRAVALHPSRENGLVAEVKVARTPLGDETLELADDGCLDASAGFEVKTGGWRWETRSRYRVEKAFLVHIALVSDGQYGENAGVLAVRQTEPARAGDRAATPLRDALELQLLREQYARIDARYL